MKLETAMILSIYRYYYGGINSSFRFPSNDIYIFVCIGFIYLALGKDVLRLPAEMKTTYTLEKIFSFFCLRIEFECFEFASCFLLIEFN